MSNKEDWRLIMSTWNYRVVNESGILGLYEVYYDKDGNPDGMSLNAMAPEVDEDSGIDALKQELQYMLDACEKDLFIPPECWKNEKE